jgi:transposase-like protein
MSDINCPYCDAELYVCHDDGYGYEENVNHQMECHKCEKSFVFQTSISFYYEAEKADCLNDGNHNWKKNHTQEFNIPSYEEYCKEVYGDTK